MACTPANFKIRFPEFVGVDDSRVQLFLDDATGFMGDNDSRWRTFYDQAQCYLAAHLLTVSVFQSYGDSTVNAPVSKKEVDDVLIMKAVKATTASEGEFGSTSYGIRYLGYRKICFGAYILGV